MTSRAAFPIILAFSLAACGSDPAVNETNASVEEVSEKVREASRDQGLVRPGKWVSTVTIENVSMPGMPPEMAERMKAMLAQSRTAETCLTEEEAQRPKEDFFAANENCRYDQFTMSGGKIDATMRCEQEGATQVMQMTGTYSPNSYEMRMRSTTAGGAGAEAMSLEMKVDAERVGKCDDPLGG